MVLVVVCLATIPATAQTTLQRIPNAMVSPRPLNPAARDIRLQASKDIARIETAEICAAHNKYLREKTLPSLRNQLGQLQSLIADRKRHSFSCSEDGSQSLSGEGAATDCGAYACNPVDGLCRTKAKTSFDCARGFYWVSGGGCVPPG